MRPECKQKPIKNIQKPKCAKQGLASRCLNKAYSTRTTISGPRSLSKEFWVLVDETGRHRGPAHLNKSPLRALDFGGVKVLAIKTLCGAKVDICEGSRG